MSALPEPRKRGLPELARELRREIEAADAAWHDALGHAICAGELLTEAKAQVKHGEWGQWLDANFPGARTTATNYMRLARESATVADLPTVREAVATLAEPREPTTRATKGQAYALLQAIPGWVEDALEAIYAGDPVPPVFEPEGDDDEAMAHYWLDVAERCSVATRRLGRRALAMGARSEGPDAAVYARAAAAGFALAEAKPYEDGYVQLHEEFNAATHGLGPMVEREPEVVSVLMDAWLRILADIEEGVL
jgi:hypothetical protein